MTVILETICYFFLFLSSFGKIESVLLAAVSLTFPESGVSCVQFGSYIAPLWQLLSQIPVLVWKHLLEQCFFYFHI